MLKLQHNVVSILYSVKGYIESHLNKTEENLFRSSDDGLEHAQSVMKRIYDQTNRALAITKRISLAMKAERRSDSELEDVSVLEIWLEAVGILRGHRLLKNIEVINHVSHEYPKIRCSHNDLLEIFYTLAKNAIEAMGKKGKLIIRAYIQISSGDNPVGIITISDTGPGISQEILSNLFEPFFTTKSLEKGNGLGLCLVRSLVKRNGGCITVSSFKGLGTAFSVAFPLEKQDGPVILASKQLNENTRLERSSENKP